MSGDLQRRAQMHRLDIRHAAAVNPIGTGIAGVARCGPDVIRSEPETVSGTTGGRTGVQACGGGVLALGATEDQAVASNLVFEVELSVPVVACVGV